MMVPCVSPQGLLLRKITLGIRTIYDSTKLLPSSEYAELREDISTFCTYKSLPSSDDKDSVKYHIRGGELFRETECCLKDYLETVTLKEVTEKHISGGDLLRFYIKTWTHYRQCNRILKDVFISSSCSHMRCFFQYMDQPAINAWYSNIFIPLFKKIAEAIAAVVDEQRRRKNDDCLPSDVAGNSRNYNLIIDLGQNLAELNYGPWSYSSMVNYSIHLRDVFLESTENFYKEVRDIYSMTGTLEKYLNYITTLYIEEVKWTQTLFSSDLYQAIPKWRELFFKILSPNNFDVFDDEFRTFLAAQNIESTRQVFWSMKEIFQNADKLEKLFNEHTFNHYKSAIAVCGNDFREYLETIFSLQESYETFVLNAFDEDYNFMAMLKSIISTHINGGDPTIKGCCNNVQRFAEYCACILMDEDKSLTMPDLDEVVTYYSKIWEQDEFQKKVAEMLVTHDFPDSSLIKFRRACDTELSPELYDIVRTFENSKEVSKKFENHLDGTVDPIVAIKFIARIFKSEVWPFNEETCDFLLPSELKYFTSKFETFYAGITESKKKVRWDFRHSIGELAFNLSGKEYIITANTFQIAILLQFNHQRKLTVKQLIETTGLDEETITTVLKSIVHTSLLKTTDTNTLTENSVLEFCTAFRYEKDSIDLTSVQVKEHKIRKITTNFESNRNFLISAATVRLLKAFRSLTEKQLCENVEKELRYKLNVSHSEIMDSIKKLIEKDYIQILKTEGEEDKYHYVP